MHATGREPPRGFSLIELLIAIVLLSVVLAFGVPAFTGLTAKTKMANAANSLLAHLQYARSEAVKRGRNQVAVGPSAAGGGWLDSQSWDGGYMVATVQSAATPAPIQVLRRVAAPELAGVTITTNGGYRVYFQSDGSSSVNMTLTICDRFNANNKRAVVIDSVGRVRVTDYAPGGGSLVCP